MRDPTEIEIHLNLTVCSAESEVPEEGCEIMHNSSGQRLPIVLITKPYSIQLCSCSIVPCWVRHMVV